YGGVLTVLIHPNILDHKLRFETGLIDALRQTAWIGALDEFGDWWKGRDQVELDIVETNQGAELHLTAHEAVPTLTVLLPSSCTVKRDSFAGSVIKSARPWGSIALVVSLQPGDQRMIPLDGCPLGDPSGMAVTGIGSGTGQPKTAQPDHAGKFAG
ncbi:MAG: hypothetical protein NNA18_08695, partial [Nitrospira sp.]|nr:hypothetical protein [Nitrospira sp.]